MAGADRLGSGTGKLATIRIKKLGVGISMGDLAYPPGGIAMGGEKLGHHTTMEELLVLLHGLPGLLIKPRAMRVVTG